MSLNCMNKINLMIRSANSFNPKRSLLFHNLNRNKSNDAILFKRSIYSINRHSADTIRNSNDEHFLMSKNNLPTKLKSKLAFSQTSPRQSDPSAIKSTEQLNTSKPYESMSAQKARTVVAEQSYFDTHSFISLLMKNGFTQQQAEQLCLLFKEIVNYVSEDIKKQCVTKSGQDLAIQQVMIHIGSLKKDMIILEKSEFSALRNENEKLIMELKSLRDTMNDEIGKLKGNFKLDINLEKNRSTEVTYEITNKVHKIDSRIDTEISNVKAILEQFKAETVRYIAGSLFTGLVIILGALRYFTS